MFRKESSSEFWMSVPVHIRVRSHLTINAQRPGPQTCVTCNRNAMAGFAAASG